MQAAEHGRESRATIRSGKATQERSGPGLVIHGSMHLVMTVLSVPIPELILLHLDCLLSSFSAQLSSWAHPILSQGFPLPLFS